MYRSVVAAILSFTLLVAPTAAEERAPSAIEVAAYVAACMHQGRAYPTPDGLEGIYVDGTLASANLTEGAELFAVVHDQDGDGKMDLESIAGSASRGPGWATERERYAIDCFWRATAMAPRAVSVPELRANWPHRCHGIDCQGVVGAMATCRATAEEGIT